MFVQLVVALVFLATAAGSSQAEARTSSNVSIPLVAASRNAPGFSITRVTVTPPSQTQVGKLVSYASADGMTIALYMASPPITASSARSACGSAGWTLGRLLSPALYQAAHELVKPFMDNHWGAIIGIWSCDPVNKIYCWESNNHHVTMVGFEWHVNQPSLIGNKVTYVVNAHTGKLKGWTATSDTALSFFLCSFP